MAHGSGQLPQMIEVDEDGCQWAAAAVLPSDLSMEDSGSDTEITDELRRSPHSAIHMGAPPPPPPPLPSATMASAAAAATEEMTPPPRLTQTTLSPIETTHERFTLNDLNDIIE